MFDFCLCALKRNGKCLWEALQATLKRGRDSAEALERDLLDRWTRFEDIEEPGPQGIRSGGVGCCLSGRKRPEESRVLGGPSASAGKAQDR